MRIYLDACCLLRPFDDQTQQRVRMESEAVCAVLELCAAGVHEWISSEAIEEELLLDVQPDRGGALAAMLRFASERLLIEDRSTVTAERFAGQGIGAMDAVHLALAEHGRCDVLLTTDDRLIRRTAAFDAVLQVKVQNPTDWLLRELQNDS